MTRDEILAMAREAGLQRTNPGEAIEAVRFAALVAAKEREGCLLAVRASTPCITENDARVVANCLGAIRARGQKDAA